MREVGKVIEGREEGLRHKVRRNQMFELLPGTPRLVVSDVDQAIKNAVAARWPQTTPRRNWSSGAAEPFWLNGEYHLRQYALAHAET